MLVQRFLIALFKLFDFFGAPIDVPRPVLHLERVKLFLSLEHFPLNVLVFLPVIQYLLVLLLFSIFVSRLFFEVFGVILEEVMNVKFFILIGNIFLIAVVNSYLSV